MYRWYARVSSAHCQQILYSGLLRFYRYSGYLECHLLWPHLHAWWMVGVSYPPYWVSKGNFGIVVCSTREIMVSHNQWQHQWLVHTWLVPGNCWRYSQCIIYHTMQRQSNDFQVLSCLSGNQVLTWDHPESHDLNWIRMQPRLIYDNLADPVHYLSTQVR